MEEILVELSSKVTPLQIGLMAFVGSVIWCYREQIAGAASWASRQLAKSFLGHGRPG